MTDEHQWIRQALAGRYTVVRLLGRGATGVVFLAQDALLQRYVAVKALLPEFAGDPDRREQFHREARTNARLAHPNVVPVFDFAESRGVAYSVMRYVAGPSLGYYLARGHLLPVAEVCLILADLAGALDYAHRQRVVHRDIKPENVLLDKETGRPMLTDFGIARGVSLDAMRADEIRRERMMIRGTAHFMSPEQAAGDHELDGRSDLYSLGVLGYALLSGTLPFDGGSFVEIAERHGSAPLPSLAHRAPHVPPGVTRVIERALAKRADERWATGAEMRGALLREGVRPESLRGPVSRLAGWLRRAWHERRRAPG